jgi:putative peptidoglycan lipid II flippase
VLLLAGAARLATHLAALRDKLRLYSPAAAWGNPAVKRYFLLAAPVFVGVAFARIRDVYNYFGAFAGQASGLMTANAFGRTVFSSLSGLVPSSVGIAMLPFLCEMASHDDKRSVGDLLTKSCRMLLAVFAPMAVGVAVLSAPLVRVLYQSGRMPAEAVELASLANICYIAGLPAMAIELVIMQTFFSDKRTVAPTAIGIVTSSASMVWSWYAVARLNLAGAEAIAAVALGYTASRYLKIVWLAFSLKRTVPAFPAAATAVFLGKLACVVAATGLAAWGSRALYETAVNTASAKTGMQVLMKVGPELLVASAAGFAAFLAACRVLGVEEPGEMLRWAREKLRRRGKSSPGGARGAGAGEID